MAGKMRIRYCESAAFYPMSSVMKLCAVSTTAMSLLHKSHKRSKDWQMQHNQYCKQPTIKDRSWLIGGAHFYQKFVTNLPSVHGCRRLLWSRQIAKL
jgi:hypothetical protein